MRILNMFFTLLAFFMDWRQVILLVQGIRAKKLDDLLDTSSVSFYVLPSDIDANGHLNNVQYVKFMELAWLWHAVVTGVFRLVLKDVSPVIATRNINYRVAVKPWSKVTVKTKLCGWKDHKVFAHQWIAVGESEHASSIMSGAFLSRSKRKKVWPSEIARALGHSGESPALPAAVLASIEADDSLITLRPKLVAV